MPESVKSGFAGKTLMVQIIRKQRGFFKTYSQMADVWLRFLIRNLGKSRKAGSRLLQSHRIHTPALCERFSKRRFAVFERFTSRKPPDKCRISNVERKGSVIEKQGFGSTGSSTNKEVQNTVDLKKIR